VIKRLSEKVHCEPREESIVVSVKFPESDVETTISKLVGETYDTLIK
jgi:hypothetical protein